MSFTVANRHSSSPGGGARVRAVATVRAGPSPRRVTATTVAGGSPPNDAAPGSGEATSTRSSPTDRAAPGARPRQHTWMESSSTAKTSMSRTVAL